MNENLILAMAIGLVGGCLLGFRARALRPWPYPIMAVALAIGGALGSPGSTACLVCFVAIVSALGFIAGSLAQPPRQKANH